MSKYLDENGLLYLWGRIKNKLTAKQDKLTGEAGQVVGFDADGAATLVPGWSNPNLIINWDFRNPVNRNGLSEYTSGYTIDKWNLVQRTAGDLNVGIESDGLRITKTLPEAFGRLGIYIYIDSAAQLAGKTVTFSMLAKGNSTPYMLIFQNGSSSGQGITKIALSNEYMLYKTTVTLKSPLTSIHATFGFMTSDPEGDIFIEAAKLELGDHQTLARQNDAGEWEIIDPSDYDLQYLLCSQYSPSTGEFVGSQHSNLNLLDNAYWASKDAIINQRGQDEYTSAGYTIDRWQTNVVHVTLDDKMQLTNLGNVSTSWWQKVEGYNLAGKTVTMSLLTTDGLASATYTVPETGAFTSPHTVVGFAGVDLYASAAEAASDIVEFRIRVLGNISISPIAAKLELGPVQTLAHKEGDTWVLNDPAPDKALELAKCQRYQVVIGGVKNSPIGVAHCSTSQKCYFQVAVPVPLRANPTIRVVGNIRYVTCMPSGTTAITYSTVTSAVVSWNSNQCSGNMVFDDPILPPGTVGWIDTNDATARLIIDANL